MSFFFRSEKFFVRYLAVAITVLALSLLPGIGLSSTNSKIVRPRVYFQDDVEKTLKKYLGISYKIGGYGMKGMDCSGFVKHAFNKIFEIDLPRSSAQQVSYARLEKVTKSQLNTGDLLFFSAAVKSKRISHVGIYLEDGNFIHSQGKKGVIISRMDTSYWKARLRSIRRLSGVEIRPDKTDPSLASSRWNLALSEWSDISMTLASFKELRGPLEESGDVNDYRWAASSRDLWMPALQSFRMDYTYELDSEPIAFAITAFRDEIPYNTPWHLQTQAPILGITKAEAEGKTYYRQGLRLGGTLVTDEGIYLRPSVGFLEYKGLNDRDGLARRSFELGLELSSQDNGWSILADLLYSDRKNLSEELFERNDIGISVDMSLTLRHQLNERVGIAVTGQRSLNDLTELEEASGVPGHVQKSLFFKFDYRY